jgi:hypothetical protein
MSIDAVSGLSGSEFALLNRASQVTQVSTVAPAAAATAAAKDANDSSISKPDRPILLVPTQPPLSAQVLAELIGRHLSPTGLSASD